MIYIVKLQHQYDLSMGYNIYDTVPQKQKRGVRASLAYSAEKTVTLKVKRESVQRNGTMVVATATKVYAAIVGVVIQPSKIIGQICRSRKENRQLFLLFLHFKRKG